MVVGRSSSSSSLAIGAMVSGRFRIDALLAKSTLTAVYLATQPQLARRVSLRVLRKDAHADDPSFVERCRLESEKLSALDHPNLVKLLDAGETEAGDPFMVMELLEGKPMHQLLADGPFELERLYRVALQIANALRRAHQLGVVHGDLKPSNVVLIGQGDEEISKLVGLGLAGLLRGNRPPRIDLLPPTAAQYMAPEQAEHPRVDERTDVYSFGAILFHMAAGHPPFSAPTSREILAKHATDVLPAIGRGDLLEMAIRRCLKKDPGERFANMTEVVRALKHAQSPSRSISQLVEVSMLELVDSPVAADAALFNSQSHTAPDLEVATIGLSSEAATLEHKPLPLTSTGHIPAEAAGEFAALTDTQERRLQRLDQARGSYPEVRFAHLPHSPGVATGPASAAGAAGWAALPPPPRAPRHELPAPPPAARTPTTAPISPFVETDVLTPQSSVATRAIAALACFAIVACAIALAMRLRGSSEAAPTLPPPPPERAPAAAVVERAPAKERAVEPVPAPAPAPQPARSTAQVSFKSEPLGAQVYSDGKLLGVTPFSVEMAVSTAEHRFVFRRRGYYDATLETAVDEPGSIKLTAALRAGGRAGARSAPSVVTREAEPAPPASELEAAKEEAPAPRIERQEPAPAPVAPTVLVAKEPAKMERSKKVPAHVLQQQLVSKTDVRLPPAVLSAHAGEHLRFAVLVCVAADGSVDAERTRMISSVAGIEDAVLGAVRAWRYQAQALPVCGPVHFDVAIPK